MPTQNGSHLLCTRGKNHPFSPFMLLKESRIGMGFMAPKRSTLLLILILVSLFSASFGGGQRRFFDESKTHMGASAEEPPRNLLYNDKAFHVHPRILKVQTNDYGSYDPPPAVAKPPYKLIPN